MNLADVAIRNRTTTLVLTAGLLFGGISAYGNLSRLEDPEFTIKDALVITPYPGATAAEVEEEVTRQDREGRPAAGPAQGGRVQLRSRPVDGHRADQGQVRQGRPAPGLGRAAAQGERRPGQAASRRRPLDRQRRLRRRLGHLHRHLRRGIHVRGAEGGRQAAARASCCSSQDVAKIDFWGDRHEAVYVEPNRDRMSQLGIHPAAIMRGAARQEHRRRRGPRAGRAGVHRHRADRHVLLESRTSKTC